MNLEDKFLVGATIMWAAYLLFVLALLGGVGYVAYHFITKFW